MSDNKKIIEVLNDLIRINHDRTDGYHKASDELKESDADLKTLFNRFASESRQHADDLVAQVRNLGGDPATDTTQSGKIYRAWMDVKATFTGHDRHAVLSSCEFGEDAAQKAYDDALSADVMLPPDIRQLIIIQQASLKDSHDEVKKLRGLTRKSNQS
jgi:uncharacterized protein (TIGR02284 family)